MLDLTSMWPVQIVPGINDTFRSIGSTINEKRVIRTTLTREYLGRIKWSSQTKIHNLEHMEDYLLTFGAVSLWRYDVTGDLFITPFTMYGKYNVYSYPSVIRPYNPYGGDIFNIDKLDMGNFAVCFENGMRTSTVPVIRYYSDMMSQVLRVFNSRLKAAKISAVLISDSIDSDLTTKNLKKQLQEDSGFLIFRNKEAFQNAMNVYDLKIQIQAADFIMTYEKYHNYYREMIGINCNPTEKKERLVNAEVNSNNISIDDSMYDYIKERENFCEYANKIFNAGIKAEIYIDNVNKKEGD